MAEIKVPIHQPGQNRPFRTAESSLRNPDYTASGVQRIGYPRSWPTWR